MLRTVSAEGPDGCGQWLTRGIGNEGTAAIARIPCDQSALRCIQPFRDQRQLPDRRPRHCPRASAPRRVRGARTNLPRLRAAVIHTRAAHARQKAAELKSIFSMSPLLPKLPAPAAPHALPALPALPSSPAPRTARMAPHAALNAQKPAPLAPPSPTSDDE